MGIDKVHCVFSEGILTNYIINNSECISACVDSSRALEVQGWLKTNNPTINLEGEAADSYWADKALASVNLKYEEEVTSVADTAPVSEVETWSRQEAEARAWVEDNEAITPILDGICETREVTKEWLVYKVIEKADKYISSIGKIIGKRQKAEKEITNAN